MMTANYNKYYKYLDHNKCDDCNKFYPKGLAVHCNSNVYRCHICHQKLRLKPKNIGTNAYKELHPYRPSVEFIYCKCGCGKTRPKYTWLNKMKNRFWRNKPAQYINGHSLKKSYIYRVESSIPNIENKESS
jgi:hypothetical protein